MKQSYITFDGMVFDDANEALEHEDELNEINSKLLAGTVPTLSEKEKVIDFFKRLSCIRCPFEENCKELTKHIRTDEPVVFLTLCDVILSKQE